MFKRFYSAIMASLLAFSPVFAGAQQEAKSPSAID
jgi:hypothetical protein